MLRMKNVNGYFLKKSDLSKLNEKPLKDKIILLFLLSFGLRITELSNLKLEDYEKFIRRSTV